MSETPSSAPTPVVTHEEEKEINLSALNTKNYLDKTVVPILLQGLAALAQERPPNPVEYLAAYLLRNNPNKTEHPLDKTEEGEGEIADTE
ncbi:Sdc1/DPY30 like protein [Aduncisulcus paluster]|uniref:Protein dpy-30 homolog n=1 Tax=Aduncisulcus paluster TaxID=2918883 RepID=A0ABQ5K5I1_9EUKA|nr:Sdc1/DPY30 like protein [Aduncisulcus paluster]